MYGDLGWCRLVFVYIIVLWYNYSTCFHEDLEINIFGSLQALDEYNYTKNLSQTQTIQDLDFIGFSLFSPTLPKTNIQ